MVPKPRNCDLKIIIGRGALYVPRSYTVRSSGAHTSENAGISKRKGR